LVRRTLSAVPTFQSKSVTVSVFPICNPGRNQREGAQELNEEIKKSICQERKTTPCGRIRTWLIVLKGGGSYHRKEKEPGGLK